MESELKGGPKKKSIGRGREDRRRWGKGEAGWAGELYGRVMMN